MTLPEPSSTIYLASSWRNNDQPHAVGHLRDNGFEVYDFRQPTPDDDGFAWSDIDLKWEKWTPEQYLAAIEHPLAIEGFGKDFAAMQRADTFVLLLPCGRSAHLEMGWAVGAGKRTVIVLNGAHEPELMNKMADQIVASIEDAVKWLKGNPVEAVDPREGWSPSPDLEAVEHEDMDGLYGAEHTDTLLVRDAESRLWLAWETEDGDWFAVRPRDEDDPALDPGVLVADEWRPVGPMTLGSLPFPVTVVETGHALTQSLRLAHLQAAYDELRAEYAEARADRKAVMARVACDCDTRVTDLDEEIPDDCPAHPRAALRAVRAATLVPTTSLRPGFRKGYAQAMADIRAACAAIDIYGPAHYLGADRG